MITHEDDEENREDRVPGRHGFPGGTAKLPRLVGPAAEDHVLAPGNGGPAVMIVEGGFAAGRPRTSTPTGP